MTWIKKPFDPYITVVVGNRGRGQVDVSTITLHLLKGNRGSTLGKRSHPALPMTLEGGSEASWQFRFDTVLASLGATRNESSDVYSVVRLGNGKSVQTDCVCLEELFKLIGGAWWHELDSPAHKEAID